MEAIELHRARAVEATTDSIYQQLGAGLERFGDRGRQCCEEDLHRHVDYLGGSLVAGQTELFGRYIVWLNEVLSVREVPLDSLSLSLELLQAYYEEQLAAESNEVIQLALHGGLQTLRSGAPSLEPLGSIVDPESCHPACEDLVDALVSDNKPRALELIREVARQAGHIEMLVGLVQPAMYRIGDRWKLLEIGVADEHSATAMARRLTGYELRNAIPQEPNGKKALLACVESNRHAFGLRMVADAHSSWTAGTWIMSGRM
ncbi:MAG: B12-binding domain-containing protein [Halofilum sp. (in: g-proteobacteria)]|nr:B12-binding domain-containing protein [Halofilum sp. (in: g-proteobacteria)]